jgi:hypothetical protein
MVVIIDRVQQRRGGAAGGGARVGELWENFDAPIHFKTGKLGASAGAPGN